MKTIFQYYKKVNLDSLENKEATDLMLHLTQTEAYRRNPDNTKFHREEVEGKYWYYALNIYDENHAQKNCRQNVSASFADSPLPKEKVTRKKIDKREKYPILFNCSEQEKEPFDFYKGIIKEFVATLRYMSMQKNGKTIFFPQNQAGNENYQIKKKWEMIDYCKHFDSVHKYCYFVTITLDPKKWNLQFLQRWKPFAEARNKMIQKLIERFGGDYVWINEAQLSGNPHTHLLYYTDYDFKNTHFHKGKKKKSYFIDGGEFFDEIHKLWDLGFLQLDINRRKNTYNYLVKYIAKAVTHDLKKSLKSKKREEEACKNILSIVCPIATNTRSWGHSEAVLESASEKEKQEEVEFSARPPQTTTPILDDLSALKEITSSEVISYLKTLSNKSEPGCIKKIGFYSQRRLDDLFCNNGERANEFPEERKAKIHEETAKSKCCGCVLIHLMKYFLADNKDFYLFRDQVADFACYFMQADEKYKAAHFKSMKTLSQINQFMLYTQYVNYEMGTNYSTEEIKEFFRIIFMAHWSLWYLLLPSKVATYFIHCKNTQWSERIRRKTTQRYKDIIFDIFDTFLLTNTASGSNI